MKHGKYHSTYRQHVYLIFMENEFYFEKHKSFSKQLKKKTVSHNISIKMINILNIISEFLFKS